MVRPLIVGTGRQMVSEFHVAWGPITYETEILSGPSMHVWSDDLPGPLERLDGHKKLLQLYELAHRPIDGHALMCRISSILPSNMIKDASNKIQVARLYSLHHFPHPHIRHELINFEWCIADELR